MSNRRSALCFVTIATLFSINCVSAFAMDPKMQHYRLMKTFGEQSQLGHDYPKAEKYFATALQEARAFGARSSQVQECESRLATILVLQGRLKEAESHYSMALSIAVEMLKKGLDEPESFVWLDDLSDAYELMASTKEPLICYAHCYELRKAISPRHKNLATAEVLYGSTLIAAGKVAQGDKMLKESYALSCRVSGPDTMNTGTLCLNITNSYRTARMFKDADTFCEIAVNITEKRLGDSSDVVANIVRLRAIILTKLSRYKEAEREANKALAIHQKKHGSNYEDCAYDYSCLAKIYQSQHRLSDAESASNKAVAIANKVPAAVPAMRAELLETAAGIQHDLHHEPAALKLMNQAKALKAIK